MVLMLEGLIGSAPENVLVPGHALFCKNVPAGISAHGLVSLLQKVVLIHVKTLSIEDVLI